MTTEIYDSGVPAVIATGLTGRKNNGVWEVDNCVAVPPHAGVQPNGWYMLRMQDGYLSISVICTGVGIPGAVPATFVER